jgi:hypothetical protein
MPRRTEEMRRFTSKVNGPPPSEGAMGKSGRDAYIPAFQEERNPNEPIFKPNDPNNPALNQPKSTLYGSSQ